MSCALIVNYISVLIITAM